MTGTALRPTLRFTLALIGTSLKAAVSQRGTFLLQALFMAANNFVFFTFWWVLLGRVPSIGGYGIRDMTTLYGVVAAGYGIAVTFAGGVHELSRYIYEGELDALLPQPKPTLLYALGSRSKASGVGDIASGLLLIALSAPAHWTSIPVALVAVIASACVFLASGVLFFSLAFWLGCAEAVSRQLWDALLAFSMYPEPLFGGALKLLLFSLIPAGFVGYLPARYVRAPTPSALLTMLTTSVIYTLCSVWVFERGLRRYCGGSRFGTFG